MSIFWTVWLIGYLLFPFVILALGIAELTAIRALGGGEG